MSLRRRLLSRLQALIADDPLPLRLAFWDGEAFDFAPTPAVTLTLHSRALMRALLTGRIARLGDAYVAGELTVDGRIEDILGIGIRIAERVGRYSRLAALARPFTALAFRHSKSNDAAAIAHHYDVSNDFYRLWLDAGMTYSCAYFQTGDEDIDTAQAQKIEHICRKLRLAPGERVLDIGCGWGGLLRQAAQRYGITGVGITNSPAQYELARERIAADGLADRIDIRLQDYRDLAEAETFDKIVSVGMYEHVGLANLPAYFGIVARLLKPGGAVLNHGIVATDAEGTLAGPAGRRIHRPLRLSRRRIAQPAAGPDRNRRLPAWRPPISRTCARITPAPCCCGCAGSKRSARQRSPPAAPNATASGGSSSPAWPTPSTAAGCRSPKCSPTSRAPAARRRGPGRAATNIATKRPRSPEPSNGTSPLTGAERRVSNLIAGTEL